jgi:glycerol-3-phosphate dehydrogenase
VNVAGPWAERLLSESGISSEHVLDLVRGSHILLSGTLQTGFLVEIPHERRICFVLPYDGAIMVGTTEVRQTLDDPIVCSDAERAYLLNVYNTYFADRRTDVDILRTFAGVRPLLRSADDPSKASREYAIERKGRLVTVFGGKWTTARALARRVGEVLSCRRS